MVQLNLVDAGVVAVSGLSPLDVNLTLVETWIDFQNTIAVAQARAQPPTQQPHYVTPSFVPTAVHNGFGLPPSHTPVAIDPVPAPIAPSIPPNATSILAALPPEQRVRCGSSLLSVP